MGKWSQATGGTRFIVIEPEVRAYWSRGRAWHGEDATLFVEARNVKDGTKLKVQIWEEGADTSDPKGYVVELDQGYVVSKGRCQIDHTIKWDQDSLGKPLVLANDDCFFYFLVILDDVGVKAKSNLLYVHVHDHVLSG